MPSAGCRLPRSDDNRVLEAALAGDASVIISDDQDLPGPRPMARRSHLQAGSGAGRAAGQWPRSWMPLKTSIATLCCHNVYYATSTLSSSRYALPASARLPARGLPLGDKPAPPRARSASTRRAAGTLARRGRIERRRLSPVDQRRSGGATQRRRLAIGQDSSMPAGQRALKDEAEAGVHYRAVAGRVANGPRPQPSAFDFVGGPRPFATKDEPEALRLRQAPLQAVSRGGWGPAPPWP